MPMRKPGDPVLDAIEQFRALIEVNFPRDRPRIIQRILFVNNFDPYTYSLIENIDIYYTSTKHKSRPTNIHYVCDQLMKLSEFRLL